MIGDGPGGTVPRALAALAFLGAALAQTGCDSPKAVPAVAAALPNTDPGLAAIPPASAPEATMEPREDTGPRAEPDAGPPPPLRPLTEQERRLKRSRIVYKVEAGAGLDGSQARYAVVRHDRELRECHARGLDRKPGLEGKVDFRFDVTPKGTVRRVRIAESTIGDRRVEACAASVLRSARFPRPGAGAAAGIRAVLLLRPAVPIPVHGKDY